VTYTPKWCAPEPKVCFADVLRSRSDPDPQALSIVSLQVALRDARLDQGGSFAIVPTIRNLLTSRTSVTRLVATCADSDGGEPGRAPVHVVTGVSLREAERLGGHRGLSWFVYAGPETDARVWLVRDGPHFDVGEFNIETVITGIGFAFGTRTLGLERVAENWIEHLLEQRWRQSGGRLQEVSMKELWLGDDVP